MIRLSTQAKEALRTLARAGGELVLLDDDWHERPVRSGLQTVRGPCWVAPDRGPGRRPAVLRIVSLEAMAELQHEGLATIRDRRAELTERAGGRSALRPLAATETRWGVRG